MNQAEGKVEFADGYRNVLRPFGFRDKLGYMFGDLGGSLFFMLVNTYLIIYFTDVLHIHAAVIGALFLITNIWNATVDVLWGRFLDSRKNTIQGKFTPWIFRMSFPLVMTGILMFVQIPGIPNKVTAIWAMVMYVLWGTLYSTVNIPYGSMASVISNNPAQRTSLSVWRTMGSSLAGLVINVGGPIILFVNNEASGNRFFITAVILGIFSFLFIMICVRLTTERVVVPEKEREKGQLKNTVSAILRNRALIWLLVVSLIFMATMLMIGVVYVYLFKNYFGTTAALSLVGFIQTAVVFVAIPIINPAVIRFGKKGVASAGLFITSGIYILLYVLPDVSVTLFVALTAIGMFGMNIFNLITWAFVTDVTDYHEYITGMREDGTVYSVYSFSRKIGQALAGGLSGFAITAVGYDAAREVQSPEVLDRIYMLATLIPGILFFLGFLALAYFYPLNKKKTNELSFELARARRR